MTAQDISLETYRSFFENAIEGIYQTTLEGRFRIANPALARILGYDSAEQLINEVTCAGTQLYPNPDFRRQFTDELAQHGQVQNWITQLRRRDGSLIWVSENARLVRNGNGEPLYYEGTIEDISTRVVAEQNLQQANAQLENRVAERTQSLLNLNETLRREVHQRTQAQTRLEASEEIFRSLVQQSKDGIVIANSEGSILVWNQAMSEITGVTFEETRQLPIWEVQSQLAAPKQRDPQRLKRLFESLLQNPKSEAWGNQQDLVFTNLQGQPRRVLSLLFPIHTANGLLFGSIHRDITAMQATEEQLQVQRAALLAAANGIVITDHKGHIQWANPAFTELTGYSLEEALGKTPRLLKSEQTPTEIYADLWRTITGGQVWQGELLNRRKDGSLYVQEMTITPVRATGDSISHYIAIQQDATMRYEAQKAWQRYANEQNALYQVTSAAAAFMQPSAMLESVLNVIMALPELRPDASWVILAPNEAHLPGSIPAWRGVPAEIAEVDSIGVCQECIFYHTLMTGTQPPPKQPIPIGECVGRTSELLQRAGLEYHVLIPLSIGQRTLGLLFLAWRQLPEYTEDEHRLLLIIGRQVGLALRNIQLYENARKLEHLNFINRIGAVAVSSLDANTILQRTLDMARREMDAALGRILLLDEETNELYLTMYAPDKPPQPAFRLPLDRSIAGRILSNRQSERLDDVRQDPGWFTQAEVPNYTIISLLGVPLVYDNQARGVMQLLNKRSGGFSAEDAELLEAVAQFTIAALENARLYASLKTMLQERERSQAQLIHAEKLSALGRLAASIAHEINNPLQAIQGFLSLFGEELHGQRRQEKFERYLDIMDGEISRIAAIVQRMRDFYRPSQNIVEPTDLYPVLENVLALTRKQFQVAGIEVALIWPADSPTLYVNANKLKQVFLNLILNAADAMPGGGRLRIQAEHDLLHRPNQSPQPALRIDFGDSGKGIPAEILNQIFEPFYTTKEHGSGLGLFISRQIIIQHGGEIIAKSDPASGSIFSIWLPILANKPQGDTA